MRDEDIQRLVTYLKEESIVKKGIVRNRRNNNQIIAIIQTIIRFLRWLQIQFTLNGDAILLGDESSSAQIHITIGRNPKTGRTTYTHASMPKQVAPKGDKIPIPDEYISKLRDTIFHKCYGDPTAVPIDEPIEKSSVRIVKNRYIYERRMFSVLMFKISGLRPMELCKIPLNENKNLIKERAVYLPTGKTRNNDLPLRKFPLSIGEANRIEKYFNARSEFLSAMDKNIINPDATHAILLTDDCQPLNEKSLTRDFSRLVDAAGLGNVKLCLSMFRHRFITIEILLEMQRATNNPNVAAIWNEGIRHSICAIVAAKTGHGSAESLFTYFHEAYKFSTKFDTYSEAIEHLRQLDDKLEDLTVMGYEIRRALASNQVDFAFAESTLESLEKIKSDVEALKTVALKNQL
ncbi:hypothetical protein J3P85_03285 [Pseudomonas sp. Z1-12]|uniref:hypothetical protein n=1 Tax=Pseudomonas sp. Z1-12 TaxID=2817408 RepID=UPI003DA86AF2